MAFRIMLLCTTVIPVLAENEININGILDGIIESVTKDMKEKQTQNIKIGDLERTFKQSFLKGGVKATDGVFSDLSTLQRTGDATLSLNSDSASSTFYLGLSTMQLYFSHCRAWIGKLSVSDSLTVIINKNSVMAQVTIKVDGSDCQTTLNEAKLVDLSDIRIQFKNLSKIKYVMDRISSWIVDHFNEKIKKTVENQLKATLEKELKKVNLCSLFK